MRTLKERLESFQNCNVDIESRSILLSGEIDLDTFNFLFQSLHILDMSNGDIHLYINSEGGDLSQAMAMYDLITNCNNSVIGIVYGEASSAASIILQACCERRMSKNSYIMVHIGYEETSGHPSTKKAWDTKYEKDAEWIKDVYLKRIKEKKKRYTKKQLTKLLEHDKILNTKDAIDLGLLDKEV